MKPRTLAVIALVDLLLVLLASYTNADARPKPCEVAQPLTGEPLTLETGASLPVLIVPEFDALCLHFDDWAQMETEVTITPRLTRQRELEARDLCLSQVDALSVSLADAYHAPYETWEANLKALDEANHQARALEAQVRVWRGVAVGAGVAVLVLSSVLYLAF